MWLDRAGGSITDCVIAFGTGGGAISDRGPGWDPSSTVVTRCALFENAGGNDVCCDDYDNIETDPLFCDFYDHDFTLCTNSPCLPGGNPWGELIGAHDTACGDCDSPVEGSSWGAIKAMYR